MWCFLNPKSKMLVSFSIFRHRMSHFISFPRLRIMVSASPSKHTSWNPISSAKITACRHALASAITGSAIFFHGYLNVVGLNKTHYFSCCLPYTLMITFIAIMPNCPIDTISKEMFHRFLFNLTHWANSITDQATGFRFCKVGI
ncbi:hypothetical protein ES288_D11G072700v1 [Gossypium darwinii]|uniref:Uncharacterized protein n=2 Tax=Gossypium TaxID=3633 RepID=A0A5D2IIX9_GOSTO|nr:hypothetical protein ES288_D11G072700v1 [Gossypium darwinii]TYH42563.1 hypothetical protein ES332_D11G071800v1 [Gossypium tomentosum]TYH42564.1 hypothetical protein ES332_D11G071800v1 [Gossypium tomentosum]